MSNSFWTKHYMKKRLLNSGEERMTGRMLRIMTKLKILPKSDAKPFMELYHKEYETKPF